MYFDRSCHRILGISGRVSRHRLIIPNPIISCLLHQYLLNHRLISYANFPKPSARLSKIWIPTGGTAISSDEDGHAKLIRAGFLRQAHSGIYHMLPLGKRVQWKLESLIDKHMSKLGASKLDLSSISSEDIWQRSGRLGNAKSELFCFEDRRSTKYLLSPTHEEEITSLISGTIKSYKELPIRVYQITRKYRDEPRPRLGLFRTREFLMKDLYTFDYSPLQAISTYHAVRSAYTNLFDELKLPYLQAEASSGDMGGSLSHEFHFLTPKGEDFLIKCSSCDYVANEELAETAVSERHETDSELLNKQPQLLNTKVWRGISKDRSTIINVWYEPKNESSTGPTSTKVNFHAIKSALPEFDPSVEDASIYHSGDKYLAEDDSKTSSNPLNRVVNLIDSSVPRLVIELIKSGNPMLAVLPRFLAINYKQVKTQTFLNNPNSGHPLSLLRIQDGDRCPRCDKGLLTTHKAIELGHTFHLGTRYCEPLNARVSVPIDIVKRECMVPEEYPELQSNTSRTVPLQMGCHGIGVSRMVGVIADTLADEKGLNWPRCIAPYEVVIIASKGQDIGAEQVYEHLLAGVTPLIDATIDDRKLSFPWKMQDADLIGYPVIIVVGRKWESEKICEVQCRRLKVKSEIPIGALQGYVSSLLHQL